MRRLLASHGIRAYLVLSIGGLAFTIAATLLLLGARAADGRSVEYLRARVAAIAGATAAAVDWHQLEAVRTEADAGTPEYQQILVHLRRVVHASEGLRRAFILRAASVSDWEVIASTSRDEPEPGHFGERQRVTGGPQLVAGTDEVMVDQAPWRDEQGDWIAGYAPVRNERRQMVALVGVEMSAAELLSIQREIRQSTGLALCIAMLLSFVLAEVLAHVLCRPVAKLLRGTEAVAAGDMSAEVDIGAPRELALLGRSFNAMIRALRAHHARLLELSETDYLTGLRNHRYFQDRLAQEVSRAQRYGRSLSVVMFDFDYFREVNNTYGHQAGDDVLQQFAALVHGQARESDVLTRYGGEEFAVILPDTSAPQAYEMAERVRRAVEERRFEVRSLAASRSLQLTVSGGVAEYPTDSRERDGLVMAADVALLRAKSLSRNRVCLFTEEALWRKPSLDLAQVHDALQSPNLAAVELLAEALDARDHYTRGHSENVTALALVTAAMLGLPTDEMRTLRLAALLHDIGKIGIPDSVLHKRGPLNSAEWNLVRTHSVAGAAIIAKAPLLGDLVPVVLSHHEQYDGSGYPEGLAGEAIPLGARILAVADAYDAMISDRPYRPALSPQQALAELHRGAGKQFDPTVVAAFEEALSQLPADARVSVVAGASTWLLPPRQQP